MSHTARLNFTSDNAAGAHPDVLTAVTAANTGRVAAYGADSYSAELAGLARKLFGNSAEIYPVFTGTAANVLSLAAAAPRWGAVLCAESAHTQWDEGGAPEKIAGLKLLTCKTEHGKITPEAAAAHLELMGFEHAAQPAVLSVAQVTELGTCYTPEELGELARFAHQNGMLLHVDGARLAAAAAHLGCDLRTAAGITDTDGTDILSLGATKNGALGAEAVVVLNPERISGIKYLRKHQMQLASKMRFLAAQLLALFGTELWLRNAQHAESCAQLLAAGLDQLAGATISRPVQSNAVFATLQPDLAFHAHRVADFYDWPSGEAGEVRFMCGWDTTEAEVQQLLAALRTG